MTSKDNRPEHDAELRSSTPMRMRAEAIVRERAAQSSEDPETLSPEETRSRAGTGTTTQTLHELRVHQIELEMQNEELCRAQADLDAARARKGRRRRPCAATRPSCWWRTSRRS